MSSRYIVYYSNIHFFVTVAGDVEPRYEVRAKNNPHRVLAAFGDGALAHTPAEDIAIDDADRRDELEIAAREAKLAAEAKPKRGRAAKADE